MDRLVISIGVVVLIALGIWFYATNSTSGFFPLGSNSSATSTDEMAGSDTGGSSSGSGNTYKSLLTQTGSYQCDYTQVQQSGQGRNVVYLSDGKLRAEFRTMVNGTMVSNLAVYDGRYLYQWKEGASTGTRTSITSLSQLPSAIPTDLTSGKIYGSTYESVGWQCHEWLTDPALLVLPSYVTFS